MTYAAGQDILASDFNDFAGVPTGDASPQTNKVGSIYGVGYGDRGYGQTIYTWSAKAAGQNVGSVEWTAMRNALNTCALHQGTSAATVPPTNVLDPLDTIYAETNPPRPYEFPANIAAIDTNRLNTNGGLSMTLTPSALTVTRGTSWGSGASGITCEVDFNLGSEDAARHFFNSGGTLQVQLAHPVTGTTRDDFWNSVLPAIGAVRFGAHSTTRTGWKATPNASLGYYELTTAYQQILDGSNLVSGSYYSSTNDVYVDAKAVTITGLRGAKGSVVRFRVQLIDEITGGSDTVAAGTNATFGYTRATAVLSGIAIPALTTFTPF